MFAVFDSSLSTALGKRVLMLDSFISTLYLFIRKDITFVKTFYLKH